MKKNIKLNLKNDIFKEYSKELQNLHSSIEYIEYAKILTKYNNFCLIGNGGSNAVALHIAEDISKILNKRVICFSDVVMMSCFTNDFGQEKAYLEFIKRNTTKDFFFIFISSSGESKNIINCINWCKKNNRKFGLLTGFSDKNTARKISKNSSAFNFHVKNNSYGVVECIHQIFLHGPF